jgi:hypothetical protein
VIFVIFLTLELKSALSLDDHPPTTKNNPLNERKTVMKKLLLATCILSLGAPAIAEIQIDIDPYILGATLDDHIVAACVADIGFAAGLTYFDGTVSGPDGFPELWHVVFQSDDAIAAATPFNSLELHVTCPDGSGEQTSMINFAPYTTWYLPGPANPPAAASEFLGINLECGVVNAQEDLPSSYQLGDAYPNPFNPTTTISFALPQAGQVCLKVHNMQGAEMATLVNGLVPAGSYDMTWDATNLSSGVYFYTLDVGNFSDTRKMVLLK